MQNFVPFRDFGIQLIGVIALFVHTWEPKRDIVSQNAATLRHEAWTVQGEFALTHDEPAFTRVVPKRPFDLSRSGYWSGWTFAARYSAQRLDALASDLNFADAARFARVTQAFSVAIGWYASREFRFQWIWEHSDFKGANSRYAASTTSDILIFRFTLIF